MRTAGMFVLNVEPGTTTMPGRVYIALTGATRTIKASYMSRQTACPWTSWRAT
jgi:hypothetical protein